MEEFLVVLLQFLVEFVINVVAEIPFDWPSRNRKTPESEGVAGVCFLWFLLGIGVGCISLLIFSRTLISVSALRVVSLVLAPVASAFLSLYLAKRRAVANPFIIPRNHFWQAFWFTVALVGVRFIYASRA